MENFEESFCMLCLGPVKFENSEIVDDHTRNVLSILLLKPSLDESKQLMCSDCSAKLFGAFDFKVACINTEDCIYPYVNSETEMLSDLREIYIKEKGSELLDEVPEDQKICRLCMQLTSNEVVPLEKVDATCINRYIPEVNFSYTKDPVICETCHDSLNTHSMFLRMCLYAEEKIKCLSDAKIKTEPIDTKTDEINSHSNADDEPSFKHNDNTKSNTIVEALVELEDITECQNSSKLFHNSCDKCNYGSKNARFLMKHMLIHVLRDPTGNFACDRCDYKTRNKYHLVSHQLTHKAFPDIPVHKCAECSYESIYKIHFTRHMVVHKAPQFQCDKCEYTSRFKFEVMKHCMAHGDGSEVKMHTCFACSYRTRHKKALQVHHLTHKDPSDGDKYACGECEYKTKYKSGLKRHQLKHRDPSEIDMHKCDKCRFQTKFKAVLKKHVLRHEQASAGQGCTKRD